MPFNHSKPFEQYISAPHIAEDYDAYFRESNLFIFDQKIIEEVLTQPATVLDLGCGTGRHILPLARRRYSVTGVDLSPHMLKVAKEKITRENLMARLVQGDMRDLSFVKDNFFVYALCMFSTIGMIESPAERLAFLKNLRNKLQPGGTLLLHVHNMWYHIFALDGFGWLMKSRLLSLFGRREFGQRIFKQYRGIPNMKLKVFSHSEICGILKDGGFEVKKTWCLNAKRSGEITGKFKSLRANGFVIQAVKATEKKN